MLLVYKFTTLHFFIITLEHTCIYNEKVYSKTVFYIMPQAASYVSSHVECIKRPRSRQVQWHTPTVLATQKVEERGLLDPGFETHSKTPLQNKTKQ